MKDITKGFLLGMVGVTLFSVANDIAVNYAELLKAKIGIEVARCNKEISRITDPPTNTRVIGFATGDPGEEEYDEE